MHPKLQLAALTAFALAVLFGVWLVVRDPEPIGAAIIASGSMQSASPPADPALGVLELNESASSDATLSARALAAETTHAATSAAARAPETKPPRIHLFGVVSGIPSSAASSVLSSDLDVAELENVRRVERFLATRDNPTGGGAGQAQAAIGLVQAIDEEDHIERAFIESTGNYSFPELRAGKWQLTVIAPLCQRVVVDLALRADEPERRLDVPMQSKQRIRINVSARAGTRHVPESTAESEAASAVLVGVITSREPPGKMVEGERLGNTRPCELWLLVPGSTEATAGTSTPTDAAQVAQTRTILLEDPLPLYVSATVHGVVLETKLAHPDTEELSFELDGDRVHECAGSLRLHVVDADGGPPPGDCTVGLMPIIDRRYRYLTRHTADTKPDARGDVLLAGLSAGPMTLTIRADGYESIVRTVNVTPGGPADLGEFTLDRWCSILGRTLDAEKRPVSVIVNVFPLDRFEDTRVELSRRCFKSNEDGELKIASIGRGRYLLRVRDENWGAAPVVVDTNRGTAHDVEIALARKVEAALRFERALPPNALLRLLDGANVPVLESERSSGLVQRMRVVPGLYTLRVTQGDEEVLRSALFVGAKDSEVAIPGWK